MKVNDKEAFDLIKKNCSKNFKKLYKKNNFTPIFRGVKSFNGLVGHVNSNKGEPRVSANTQNYMTLLMDNLPSWEGWPKRSRSIICASDERVAKLYSYGRVYHVIPYDNTKIGVCSEDDVWVSFPNMRTDVSNFNSMLDNIFKKFNIKESKTYYELKSAIDKVDEILATGEYDEWSFSKPDGTFDGKTSTIDNLNKILDPDKNGFKMGIDSITPVKEVWIQGESIMIEDNYFYSVFMEMEGLL